MKNQIVICLILMPLYGINAQNYSIDAIPKELKDNADVVVREKIEEFAIHSTSKATYTVHEVYSILNERGKRYATEVLLYSPLQKIVEFNGRVFDAQGKTIRKLRKLDIYDQSAISGFSLYEDNRLKAAELMQGVYPYTVEFNYKIEFRFLFHIPAFTLTSGDGVAVEKSTYILSAPANLKPRYKLLNTGMKPVETQKSGINMMEWTFNKKPAIKREPFGPEIHEISPGVLAAPSDFEFEKYYGNMNSWDNFGMWINSLNKGRGNISEETRKKIEDLTDGLTVEEKTKVVYEYLQSKTRYVSIQIGIGGFQPFDAKVVDETGYGDCKALSNYTVSMLEAAGVKANYVLIRAGRNEPKLETDFSSSQFNHAVVAVPNGADTLWLECTSQISPFGYMGTFTGDRKALMIVEDGARVVSTPQYPAERNIQSRTAIVNVEQNGNARAKIRTTYSGLQYENGGLGFILNNQLDEQKKWVEKNTRIPSFELSNFSMSGRKERIPSAVVNLDLSLRNYATVNDKRTFLNPNLMNRSTFIPERVERRRNKVKIDIGFIDMDTIHFHLPESIYPEFIPSPIKLKSRFGEYEASFLFDKSKLVYFRRLKIYKGEFSPEFYEELVSFYQNIRKADETKIFFLSKT